MVAKEKSRIVLRRSRQLRSLPPSMHAQDGNMTKMENVGRYQVLTRYALTLRCIFAKHGDIASNSDFLQFSSFLLMVVDIIVQKLLRSNFCYVLSASDHMKHLVQFATIGNLDVSCLLKHLVEIQEIRILTAVVATEDFDARKKIMITIRKWFKEVQRGLDDLIDVGTEAEYEQ